MKIAFIGQKGIPMTAGGVEKHVEELSVSLAGYGHEVLVYTRPSYTDKELKIFKGVQLVSVPTISSKHLDAIVHTFLAVLHVSFVARKVDIIHFHSIGPSSLILLAKVLNPRTPVIATFHTQCYFHQKWNWLAKIFLKFGEYSLCHFADAIIVISKSLKQYVNKKYKKQVNYIPNGVTVSSIVPADDISRWGLSKDSYILTVSRLVRHKGIHYLIKAYKELDTDKKLVIVGDGSYSDNYVQEIKKIAGVNPNIIFTGRQSGQELSELFSNAFLFVQPSESEGLSIALLEAMAYKLPVLVSDIKENKEAVERAGFYFSNKDIDNLKGALNFLLANPEIAKEKALQGWQRVKVFYNWHNISKSTEKLYEKELFARAQKRNKIILKYIR